MSAVLLVVIYLTFIGLGIPDSLFGTAWPAVYTEFHLPVSYANFVTSIISAGTIISSLLSGKLIRCFGTAKIVAVSTALTAAALFGFSRSGGFIYLCFFAVPLGIGAGAIDTALNNYVALHYKAAHMNFLHCFYGIGISLSPYLMSVMLSDSGDWRKGYRAVFWVQCAIAVMTIAAMPLWGKAGGRQYQDGNAHTAGIWDLLKKAKVRTVCLIFIGSCAVEYTCGIWGSTYLVKEKGMAFDDAAGIITFYYVGMACGRFLSGILSYRFSSWQIVKAGEGITLSAVILLLLPLPAAASSTALFLTGLGNAPVFPNMIHLTPENFGKENSQEVMGLQMSAAYVSILLAPVVFGLLAQNIGTACFPYYLGIMFAIMAVSTVRACHNDAAQAELFVDRK